jgi:serine palmitoyltransferase
MVYLSYMTLMAFGHLRDAWRKVTRSGPVGMHKPGFAPLLSDYEDFYTRRLYTRIRDCWDRPIRSNPGDFVDVLIRESDDYNKTLKTTEKTKRCFNLGSYNYLGFGDPTSPTQPSVFEALEQYGVSTCSPRTALGSTQLHHDLEALVARCKYWRETYTLPLI